MKPTLTLLVLTLVIGVVLGAVGTHFVTAQPAQEQRTALVTSDLVGLDGYEIRIWRTDLGPGVAAPKHYHPGTECLYVLEGR